MATIDVKDAAGATVPIEKPLAPGRATAAVSRPVVFSIEDAALLDGLEAALGTLNARMAGGALVNRSGTIATGGTSQTLAAANAARRYLFVQNPSTQTESLFVNFTAAALLGTSYELTPGGSLEMHGGSFVSTEAVTVVAATTGHPFVAKEV